MILKCIKTKIYNGRQEYTKDKLYRRLDNNNMNDWKIAKNDLGNVDYFSKYSNFSLAFIEISMFNFSYQRLKYIFL